MDARVIRTEITEKYLDSENILHVRVLPRAVITVENARNDVKIDRQLAGEKDIRVLYDSRERFRVTIEAVNYLQSHEYIRGYRAIAVVTHNHGLKNTIRFMQESGKDLPPIRIFPNHEKAIEWLRSFTN